MSNLLHRAIGHAINARAVQKYETQIRREHDQWAREAKLGATYYTAAPISTWSYPDNEPVHGGFEFDKMINLGLLAGQLRVAGGNSTSWQLWFQHGPLITTKMPTRAHYQARDEAAFAGASARMQPAVATASGWSPDWAEIEHRYPVSFKHLVAV